MAYHSLEKALLALERQGELVRFSEEVSGNLEMASIQLRLFRSGGPAVLFEKISHSPYRAVCNLYGTEKRCRFLFDRAMEDSRKLIAFRTNPLSFFKNPFNNWGAIRALIHALPLPSFKSFSSVFEEISLDLLPHIKHWKEDGGAYITLPQVYSEDPENPGIWHSNLGMYRIQMDGNNYEPDCEMGLHYQIQRGLGVHQAKAMSMNRSLPVSVFVGGPPAHALAAVMPLPEGIPELTFSGMLSGRNFRYARKSGYFLSMDADFIIIGDLLPGNNKPEGPFGDHMGYYSLRHNFPVLKVRGVYARKNAIWPFTVVGRPPQEDTLFAEMIHRLTGKAVSQEIPGVKEVHAVDAAGVHPLLLAIGSERYTPFDDKNKRPAEILTLANHILGTGQLSLAKYLFIVPDGANGLSTWNIPAYFRFVLERIDFFRDLHFYTHTIMDTLDYSGPELNYGSKLVLSAWGQKIRDLCEELPASYLPQYRDARIVMPGVAVVAGAPFTNYENAQKELEGLTLALKEQNKTSQSEIALLVFADDPAFVAANLENFLWVTFTRSNPSHDVYGPDASFRFKHWGCQAPLVIDARIKPHHAPTLDLDPEVEKKVDSYFLKGGPLYGLA